MKIKTNILNIFLTIVITFASFFVIQNYVPLKYLETKQDKKQDKKLGTSLTTIQSTDTLKNSRSTINDNFTALNNGKIENSTTTLPLITTLSGLTSAASLATVGTITSGTWSGTAISVAKGGTGTTSPSTYLTILGNGANGLTVASSTGTTGQFFTSNGAGAFPSWQTSAVDTAINYTWTGNHLWSGAASTSLLAVLNNLYVGTTATSTIQGSTSGTSQLQGYLNVLGTSGTSTISGNLVVSNNASTTNLTISGNQIGGAMSYTASSTSYTVTTGTITYTNSIPTNANKGMGTYTVTDTDCTGNSYGNIIIARSGITASTAGITSQNAGGAAICEASYTFTWSGNNLQISEDSDEETDSQISGTIYWYK